MNYNFWDFFEIVDTTIIRTNRSQLRTNQGGKVL